MKETVISDASCLIMLAKLDSPELITNLFERLIIPERVVREITAKESVQVNRFLELLPFTVRDVGASDVLSLLDNILDPGEAEAIAMAKSLQLLLLIDEKKGRKIAQNLGVKIIGLLGLIVLNKRRGFIDHRTALKHFRQLKDDEFRVSARLEADFLRLLGAD